MNFTKKPFLAALAAGLLGFASFGEKSHAVPITGSIFFQGTAGINGTGPGNATAFTSFSGVTVDSGSGDYASVPGGTPVTYPAAGFSFNPLDAGGISPLWTFTVGADVYSFDLDSISITSQSPFFLSLTGSGVAKITGKDDTEGTWDFYKSGAGTTLFNFASGSGASGVGISVPEGGSTVALLGFSLLGVATLRRKFKPASAERG